MDCRIDGLQNRSKQDEKQTKEKLIELIIVGIKYVEPQKQLFSKVQTLSVGLVYLFNGTSTFVGYLMPKPFS